MPICVDKITHFIKKKLQLKNYNMKCAGYRPMSLIREGHWSWCEQLRILGGDSMIRWPKSANECFDISISYFLLLDSLKFIGRYAFLKYLENSQSVSEEIFGEVKIIYLFIYF